MAKRALLVGIDEYPNPLNRLNSCVADSLAFRDMLTSLHGFDTSHITLLHNQAATLAAVTSALQDLLTGVNAGDEIVFFESSHGWQHPVGSTMVEVLCLYDDFLPDTELVKLSQAAPPNTLTVTLDSCHSGGMYKLFFANGMAIPAKIKMFTPTPEQAAELVGVVSQVSSIKYFGREPTSTADPAAIAQNFAAAKDFVNLPAVKDLPQVELNGALFAACMADETALAGSPVTNNLSAFTYAVTSENDGKTSLANLRNKVADRLAQLNVTQHPMIFTPEDQPKMPTETYISLAGAGDVAVDSTDLTDLIARILSGAQLSTSSLPI